METIIVSLVPCSTHVPWLVEQLYSEAILKQERVGGLIFSCSLLSATSICAHNCTRSPGKTQRAGEGEHITPDAPCTCHSLLTPSCGLVIRTNQHTHTHTPFTLSATALLLPFQELISPQNQNGRIFRIAWMGIKRLFY